MDATDDLALRRAGQAAQEMADELRASRGRLAKVLGLRSAEERAWAVGAAGERRVAAQLAKVARAQPGWRFLHAVPVGERGSDIDHLVVGPGGIFTVNAKHHPRGRVWVKGDTVLVNGQRVPYVRNSRHEARRAARLLCAVTGLEVPVLGLVVTVGADLIVKQQPDQVWIGDRRGLGALLRSRPQVLGGAQVEELYAAARRPGTWTR